MFRMKLFRVAIAALVLASASPAAAQTVAQYQPQITAAECRGDWFEAVSLTRLLIGSNATSQQQRQQLLVSRDRYEGYRAGGTQIDRPANCAASAGRPQAVSTAFDWDAAADAVNQAQPPAAPSTADFWRIYRDVATTTGYSSALNYINDPQAPTTARSYCAALGSNQTMDEIDQTLASSGLPFDFLAVLTVAAVETYCPQYRSRFQ
jgi:hypothetical protein